MSSVSAACIFGAYSASSAHTDTFYIVSQIIRVRNSKRHFFSKLTFPYIIQPPRFTLRQHRPQPPCLHPTDTSTITALPTPYGHIDHSRFAFTLRSHRPQPLRFTLRPHRPQPLRFALRQHRPQLPCFHPTATSTTAAPLRPTATSTTTAPHSPYSHIDHNCSTSPYGNIDHSRSAFTLRQHRPQPPCFRPTATSTITAVLSPYGQIDHNRSAFTLQQH